MKKKEIIIREILNSTISNRNTKITQAELAEKLTVSISTVNNAVKSLVQIGSVDVRRTGLTVVDPKKTLLYLASIRNLQKDIIYQTYVPKNITDIEKDMPAGTIYTMYSAYKFYFNETPADYSEVYVYAKDKNLEEIEERFPKRKGPANLFVLHSDTALLKLSKNNIAPIVQIYVDLWNARQWYAKEFLTALGDKLKK